MKILYGIQGTGNGHITRSKLITKELYKKNIEIDFIFSGRDKDKYFDMEIFKNPEFKSGFSFETKNGKINYLKTLLNLKIKQFLNDINDIDFSKYDLILTDYEPIVSWGGKVKDIPVIGIGHQYAFNYNIPKDGINPLTNIIMKKFAPVSKHYGLHWHNFNEPILPPIIDTTLQNKDSDGSILVYLPFENPTEIVKKLSIFTDTNFNVYSPVAFESSNNVFYNKLSYVNFKNDLSKCNGIITNAGFELISEALYLGKKILAKPIDGQFEQMSNAKALKKLKYGSVMKSLKSKTIHTYLNNNNAIKINFPNVAEYVCDLLLHNNNTTNIWKEVDVQQIKI